MPSRRPSGLLVPGRLLRSLPLIAFALAPLDALSCSFRATHGGPHLLLISIDTLRADHTLLGGYARETTPNLLRLAEEGVRFETAYTAMPSTGPSHASMLTGLYPATHGVLWNGMKLADSHQTLGEVLLSAGYHTAGVVSSFPLAASWGYSQGFADYIDDFDSRGATVTEGTWIGVNVPGGFDQRADQTTEEAIRWLNDEWDRSRPFFLFVHYFDPHRPYQPPPEFRGQFAAKDQSWLDASVALYDEEILYSDRAIGHLLSHLRALGLDETTLVVATADHGEGLMQHGHMEHGVHLYEEGVRVPLVFRWKGELAAGLTVAEPMSLVDLMPTLVDLIGVPWDGSTDGRSLAAVVRGQHALDPEHPVFLQRRPYEPQKIGRIFVSGEQWGIRRAEWKLIVGETDGQQQLFNLSIDPRELTNVANYHPNEVASLRAELDAWRARAPVRVDPRNDLTTDEREALRALGYVE